LIVKKVVPRILLVFVFFLVAAASFNGYFTKWTFRDGEPNFGIEKMLDATARRPYVYRQLLPQTANVIDRHTPQSIKSFFMRRNYIAMTFAGATAAGDPRYAFRYGVVLALSFGCLFLCVMLLSSVIEDFTSNRAASIIAACVSLLLTPVILTRGGYFYDPPEWLFIVAAFKIARKGNIWLLLPLAGVATLNKESFPAFLPVLVPILLSRFSKAEIAVPFSLAAGLSLATNVLVKKAFSGNPGAMMENHFLENIVYYCNPLHYFKWEYTYSILFPRGCNIINIMLLAVVIGSTWKSLSKPMQQTFMVAALINMPLFFGFCWFDELRNLSMLFVPVSVMMAHYIARMMKGEDGIGASAGSPHSP
jgi:hypothetical protein